MGADTKANTLELVRVPSSLLQRSQRGVALQALGESGSSFRAESVSRETGSMGADAGDEGCQRALTKRRTLSGGGALEVGDHRLFEDGCERGGALVSDLVVPNTAKHG